MTRNRESKDSGENAGGNTRSAERYRLALPTKMWELGGLRDGAVETETVDISRSGMFLSGVFPLMPGSMISFEVRLPCVGDQPGGTMVGQATVLRNETSNKGRTGIGAIIHQCEVWPAGRTTGMTGKRQPIARSGVRGTEKRSGAERRDEERRSLATKGRQRSSAAKERRQKSRRALPTRRKD